ncbi:MAG: hypothetical protein IJW29_00130 [Clostridia bacterium]|nr:hypothetical protein [Clostridia bacterium]
MKLKYTVVSLLLAYAAMLASCGKPADTGKENDTTTTPTPPAPVCEQHAWSEWVFSNHLLAWTRSCLVCDQWQTHAITDHLYYDERYVAPSCTKDGGFAYTCRTCDHVLYNYWVRRTDVHSFEFYPNTEGEPFYICTTCDALFWEYGSFGEHGEFNYYISGYPFLEGGYDMTVTGMGDMPDFSADNPPPWLDSPYLANLKAIYVDPGITRIGANAFSVAADGTNPYASVSDFTYRNIDLTENTDADAISGVSTCQSFKYVFDGRAVYSSEAAAYFLRFIVEQYDMESSFFGDLPASAFWFYLYDMTGDGQEELIVHTGSCEADAQYIFYTYQAGTVREAGRIGAGHAALYGISDATGVIWHHGSQGYEAAYRLTLSDEGLVRETLFESRPTPSYTVFGNAVTLTPYTRLNATNFTGGKG